MISLGKILRAGLGPLKEPAIRFHRQYFVDLSDFAHKLSELGDIDAVLEIGCGEGRLSTELAGVFEDAKVLGIDIADDPGLAYRGRSEGVDFRQMTADAAYERYGDTFDLVVMCDVLHHVPEGGRAQLVATAWDLVGAGGYLAVKDWVSTRNLATLLAYLSDRYLSRARPDFFDSIEDFHTLVAGEQGETTHQGWVRPQPNNRYVVARRPA